jgi:hypothetical protein
MIVSGVFSCVKTGFSELSLTERTEDKKGNVTLRYASDTLLIRGGSTLPAQLNNFHGKQAGYDPRFFQERVARTSILGADFQAVIGIFRIRGYARDFGGVIPRQVDIVVCVLFFLAYEEVDKAIGVRKAVYAYGSV